MSVDAHGENIRMSDAINDTKAEQMGATNRLTTKSRQQTLATLIESVIFAGRLSSVGKRIFSGPKQPATTVPEE